MSYLTHADIAESLTVRRRAVACASQEGIGNPSDWVSRHAWVLVKDDWISAVESARANTDYEGDPLMDPVVITDGMILSAVATARAAESDV